MVLGPDTLCKAVGEGFHIVKPGEYLGNDTTGLNKVEVGGKGVITEQVGKSQVR